MTAPDHQTDEGPVVTARPVRGGQLANGVAIFVVLVFVVVALLMRRDNAGATFGHKDQIFTVVLGLLAGGGFHLLARPRLVADRAAVRLRGFVGTWRVIPWEAVVAVEFPRKVRFARLRLPAEETLAIYAVNRLDREQAVVVMRELRELFALTHPDAPRPK
jgi:hypothetical protein